MVVATNGRGAKRPMYIRSRGAGDVASECVGAEPAARRRAEEDDACVPFPIGTMRTLRDMQRAACHVLQPGISQKKKAQTYQDDEDNTHRAFMMAKQDEIAQEMNKKFNGSFLKFLQ